MNCKFETEAIRRYESKILILLLCVNVGWLGERIVNPLSQITSMQKCIQHRNYQLFSVLIISLAVLHRVGIYKTKGYGISYRQYHLGKDTDPLSFNINMGASSFKKSHIYYSHE